jgi:hypothetical protein
MAIAGVATGDENTIDSVSEGAEHELGIDAAGTHRPDDSEVGVHL